MLSQKSPLSSYNSPLSRSALTPLLFFPMLSCFTLTYPVISDTILSDPILKSPSLVTSRFHSLPLLHITSFPDFPSIPYYSFPHDPSVSFSYFSLLILPFLLLFRFTPHPTLFSSQSPPLYLLALPP